jgi:hypothetical protein
MTALPIAKRSLINGLHQNRRFLMKILYENSSDAQWNGSRKARDWSQTQRPSVVVLGAGFAGLWAARTLAEGP